MFFRQEVITLANILDYLDWRGDVPFSADPFNEIDGMILSQFCYVILDGVVSDKFDEEISFADAYRRYDPEQVDTKRRILTFEQDNLLFRRLAESRRYRGTTLRGYVSDTEHTEDLQFSALTYRLCDGSGFAAFRGTDGSVVGWKEDFNLSYMQQTAGQQRAIEYVNAAFSDGDYPIRLGGHSKGGNSAIYSSLYCDEGIRRRITNIYSYDGPGFRDEVLTSEIYQDMLPRIRSFVPEASIVGMLLGSGSDPRIVKTSVNGIKQHYAYYWEIRRNRFLIADRLKRSGDVINKAISGMLSDFSDTEREIFTDSLFEILKAPDKETLKELTKLSSYPAIIKAISKLRPEQQAVMKEAFKKIAQNGTGALFKPQ
ncbi:Mbeg1-like protein [uncultured Ruminococcus sp.]|uniref:Mbeg1-like protein n=1 Tax=uncultured Ruminococcus sp. TaxID=165186 RepID=UPI002613EB9F|nr:Mbeg1-like protein [uncultured Ruminococcus sp.]